jgi:cytochrome c553
VKPHTRLILASAMALGVLAIGAGLFIWSGMYNIGADDPHWAPTRVAIENLREHSIAARMGDVQMPNLDDPRRIASGAVNYSAMCTGCHLAPGVTQSEIRPGLYPTPPNLSRLGSKDARRTFWIIKHGIKMSAMPAWGKTHTDEQMWNMTAFIRKMPGMTAEQYQALGGEPPQEDEDHMHADGEDHHAAGGMAGMDMSQGDRAESRPHSHAGGASVDHHADEGKAVSAVSAPSMEGLAPKAEPGAEAVAEAFHAALQKGDRKLVLALLAPEARIREGGETQSRETYASGHLSEDISFLKSARIKSLSMGSMPMGTTATVGSRSEIHAMHDGKPVALSSTEMLTLKKTPGGWLITRVDWASENLSR